MLTRTNDRRWVFPEPADTASIRRLRKELNFPEALCRLLVQRGYGATELAKSFLRPQPEHIHSPASLAGIGDAVARLKTAIGRREKILVHGDYDVDGICATALLVRALRSFGARVEPFVPNRLTDGYDLSDAGIAVAARAGAKLILTCDCGIVAHAAVDRAKVAGIDVIITDHHTPGPTLPSTVAVVNPNRTDCRYPFKGLAGVGVAYKLCCALATELGRSSDSLSYYLDLVALATIADLAPLTGENRALVRWGLKILQQTPNPGLQALLRTTGLNDQPQISAGQVGFVLAPRLNAAGRMGDAARGVRLLLTDDMREAAEIADLLEEENKWRRAVDNETLRDAMRMVEANFDPDRDRAVVLAAEGWHPGVIGIVASRVVEQIYRPAVLIAVGRAEGKGSARSIPGFHLYEAMRDCSEHLTRFGGHRAAAGCSIHPGKIEVFRSAFAARAASVLPDDLLIPEVRVDLEMGLEEATAEVCRLLRHAAPFGMGNPTPVFAARGIGTSNRIVVGANHLKMKLESGGASLDAIGFGMAEHLPNLDLRGGAMDVAFKLEEDEWKGRKRLQARLVDLRPASP